MLMQAVVIDKQSGERISDWAHVEVDIDSFQLNPKDVGLVAKLRINGEDTFITPPANKDCSRPAIALFRRALAKAPDFIIDLYGDLPLKPRDKILAKALEITWKPD